MLRFFDCNAAIGRWSRPRPGGYETAGELEAVLDYLEVERAVVFHAQAQDGPPALGNAMLMEELAGHARLLPSWVLMPHHTGEMPPARALVDEMLGRNVRFARLLPGKNGHGFSLAPWCSGPLLEALAAHRVPVLLDFLLFRRDDPDWGLLLDMTRRYPALPIILGGAGIGRASRTFYALSEMCPTLYLELSRYTPFRGIEALCRRMGARRLLYGSGLPMVAPGVAMTSITHAMIDEDDKALICGGNLERLLTEVIV